MSAPAGKVSRVPCDACRATGRVLALEDPVRGWTVEIRGLPFRVAEPARCAKRWLEGFGWQRVGEVDCPGCASRRARRERTEKSATVPGHEARP